MNRQIIAVAIFALTGGAAAAETVVSPAPRPMWTGFYLGLNLGGGFNASTNAATTGYSIYDWAAGVYELPFGWTAGYRTGNASVGQAGVVGGGQVGFNYQIGPNLVVGVETDFQGAGISGGGSSYALAGGAGATPDPAHNFLHLQSGIVNVSAGTGWIGTVRGRVGFLATPSVLLFATGGFAYGNTYANVATSGYHWHPGHEIAHPENPVTPTWSALDATSVGWTVGGGGEWMFLEHWSAKIEALYYDLGSQSVYGQFSPLINPAAPNSIAIINGATTTLGFRGVIARVGVNYHFN
ncbi:outer membrane protein [Methylocystis heyeri]|uniref:Outer membrane beta-barrel protein n=1 Tax=Methylocystis heyeri TaxID=391905 RepID=A0A6B8KH50_9HYPH|nr:outer membrane beta-barrel protein [Methylocystis heyeri]QGM46952.1 outer membrane beta-barrel protein [Methylocystis heyeri]